MGFLGQIMVSVLFMDIFPVAGYIFGIILMHCKDKTKMYKRILIMSALLLIPLSFSAGTIRLNLALKTFIRSSIIIRTWEYSDHSFRAILDQPVVFCGSSL